MILQNQIKCLYCEDVIYSASRHNFETCKCGKVSVDGGMDYLRRVGHGFEEQSIIIPNEVYDKCMDVLDWCQENHRSDLTRLCSIFRTIQECGYDVTKMFKEEEIE